MRLLKQHIDWVVRSLTIVCMMLGVGCDIIGEELPSYEETSIVGVGDQAPEFSIEALDGITLQMPNGEPTLLILFSHTCPDCKNMMTDLQRYISANSTEREIMAISRGGEAAEVEAFREEHNFTFKIAADQGAEIYYKYATMYVPRCYIIDSNGTIRHITYEYSTGDIEKLMAKLNNID